MSNYSQFLVGSSYLTPGGRFPGFGSGRFWVPTVPNFTSDGSGTATANRLYCVPFVVPPSAGLTYTGAKVEQTGSGTTGNMRIGIYNDSGGYPGTLNADLGVAAFPGSTGIRTVATGGTLAPGNYWLAAVCDAALVYRRIISSASIDATWIQQNYGIYSGISSPAFSVTAGFPYATHVYAALPTPFPAIVTYDTNTPMLVLYT